MEKEVSPDQLTMRSLLLNGIESLVRKLLWRLLMSDQSKITGYRSLTKVELDLINESKELAGLVGKFVDKLALMPSSETLVVDMRWVAIGKTDLQTGFMALVRAIAKPESF